MNLSSLLALAGTLAIYYTADVVYRRCGRRALLHPTVLSIVTIGALLEWRHISYARYMDGARVIALFLGPATVALAVPIYRHAASIGRSLPSVAIGLVVGSGTAIASAVGIAHALGAPPVILRSLAAKSVTTPVAMAVSGEIGGIPALTAIFVIITGFAGAFAAAWLFPRFRCPDWRARGFAMGIVSHAFGTAQALSLDATAGAFSGLAMGLNALFTAVALPLAVALFHH